MHRYMAAAAQPGGPRQRLYGTAGSGLWGVGGYGGQAAGMGIVRASSPGTDIVGKLASCLKARCPN
eukprot:1138539-Pelagomonas_calceolata.AAC.4